MSVILLPSAPTRKDLIYAGVGKALKEMDETVQVNTDKASATSYLWNLHFFFPCHVCVTTSRKVAQVW